jgi:hypothetical protein
MNVTISVLLDVNRDIDRDFVNWKNSLQADNEDVRNEKMRDALLTGYFITVNGINEFYKKKYDTDMKSMCDIETQVQLQKAWEQKDQIELQYKKRIENLLRENDDLESSIQNLRNKNSKQKEELNTDLCNFYEELHAKETHLLQIQKDAEVKALFMELQRAQEEIKFLSTSNSSILNKQKEQESNKLHLIQERFEVEISTLRESKTTMMHEIEYYRNLVEEKDLILKESFKSETKDKVLALEGIIQQKDAELRTLKTCNFVKGITGENIILSFLRENYTKHEVVHTGKAAHEGDMQFIDPIDNTITVIESKYKQTISKDDVDKFCRDVSHVSQKDGGTKCVGGVFVSLLTRNIPGKGDIHFETIANVPVMYVGFGHPDEFNISFKRYFEMFMSMCKYHKTQDAKQTSLTEFMEELNFYFNMLMKNKTRIEEFKTNCLLKMNKFVTDTETDNKLILSRVEGILQKNNGLKYKGMHSCSVCGEGFSNKRLLTKHTKTCGMTINI